MNHASQPHVEVEDEESDLRPAFVDLDDPNNEILDDGNVEAIDNEEDENNEETADSEGFPEEASIAENLNDAPDREPERDDALCVFCSRDGLPLHAIAAHPCNAHTFAASGENDEVYILQLALDGSRVERTTVLQGNGDTISLLTFSPNGAWLAGGGPDCVVSLWCTETWELRHRLRDLSGEVLTLLWHPSSLVLLAGTEDAQAAMWNVAKGTLAMYFAGHQGPVTCMVWSPDYKKVLTGSGDGGVIIFSPKTGEQEAYIARGLSPQGASVTALCFLDDDRCVVGCEDGTLHVISLRGGRAVASLHETHSQAIESLCISTSSSNRTVLPTLLLSASCDCRIAVWNVSNLELRVVLNVGESVIPAMWTRGHFIVAGCSDGEVKVWDGRSLQQEPLVRLMGHRRMILNLTFPEGSDIIATASDDGTTRFFSLKL